MMKRRMCSPKSRSVSRIEYVEKPTPVDEVASRSSNASSRPASRESRATTMTPTSHMSQDVPHRFTLPRNTVYPIVGSGLNTREAFGPRANVMSTDNPPIKFSPEEERSEGKEYSYEDETGGLPGLRQQPEDRDTLPNTETLLFRDGRRRIDLVLVYEEEDYGVMTEPEVLRRKKRKLFQESLKREGLELELEDKSMSYDGKTFFLKVHVPWKALTRYAEVMNLKLPTKGMKHIIRRSPSVEEITTVNYNVVGESEPSTISPVFMMGRENEAERNEKKRQRPASRMPLGGSAAPGMGKVWFPFNFRKMFEYNHNRIAHEPSFYTDGFTIDNDDRFLVKDRELFYTSSQRSLVVWQVMLRAKYDDSGKVGIRRLLNDNTYLAAFPLHEGRYDADSSSGYVFDRRLLYLEWGQLVCWYKRQPLWLIKKYFGDKIGLYFAWLGFYTKMLIPAAIVGVLCFLYGLCTIETDANMPSKEICNMSGPGNIILCPLCDTACDYVLLGNSCVFAKLTYLFDNPATVFFAIFMSFWATTFLELWKRRQAVIVWEWDLQNTEEDEEPRPEFEMSVKTFRINPVTREKEPYLPTWSRAWRFFATTSMVLFMVMVVMGAVLGTIVYRISLVTVIGGSSDKFLREKAKIFTSVTAAMINLVIIMILTQLYKRLAIYLTNLENPRTQTEYEDSYTFKIFVFQFVNFYSSLIYIAFFKGRFFKHPGDKEARKTEFLRIKTDVCDPAGCLSELCIQLAIIMVGKQCFNNFLEILFPKIRNWWRKRAHRSKTQDLERKYTRWEEDYHLEDGGRLALFEEYLEMVLQYGFVTLFVAAFPLAPLFALINNIGEIRLDAYKMLTQARRPLAERVEDIGAWYGILQGVTYMAVVSNAFVIGYTSDFIPRMVYKYGYSNETDLVGYIDSSLSEFDTFDYGQDMGKKNKNGTVDPPVCQYRGYRKSFREPVPEDRYTLSPQYWHVFAARLAFVVVFEHIVFALTGIMAYAIPDVPSEVRTQIQREKLLEKEEKYESGLRHQDDERSKGRDPLAVLREASSTATGRGWWGRRLSKISDTVHTDRRRNSMTSTVLEEEA